jgi:heterotetrameric sarcosine oxidase gamma subunit
VPDPGSHPEARHISPFALSDGTDGPEFTNEFGTATVAEATVPSLVCLAGNPQDDDLPATNIIRNAGGSRKIMALAPDQWLISDMDDSPGDLLGEIRRRYAGRTVVCADHSHAWNVLRLSGPAAARCLSRLCPVDLHPGAFGSNDLIQTNMAGIYILCIRTAGQGDSFDLYMSHSFSRSFFEILRDAVTFG